MYTSPAVRKPTGPHPGVAHDRARAKAERNDQRAAAAAAAARDGHSPPVANLTRAFGIATAAKRLTF